MSQEPTPAPDNVVPYADHALFMALRATDQDAVMQVIWVYEHPVDSDGLRRFRDNFARGLMARLIEPSPLPFGRHRWVASPVPSSDVDVAPRARPRDELRDWARAQVDLPLDPEWGPGWRLSVQPLTDGATAISLVVSHCIADGGAVVMSMVSAVKGELRDLGYPPPRTRTRSRAVRADLRQLVSDRKEIFQTLRKAVKVGIRRRHDIPRPAAGGDGTVATVARTASAGPGTHVTVPSATVLIDTAEWDARARELGGNSFSMAAGLAARMATHVGRVRDSDGAVSLLIPVSEREDPTDTGGNVVSIATVSFDPTSVTTDLSVARAAIRDGIKAARDTPDEMVELLPLIQFLPKRALATMVDMTFGFSSDRPVSCSNMGDLPIEMRCVDGTEAEFMSFCGYDRHPTRETLEQRNGILTLVTGRIAGKVVNTFVSYQLGAENTDGVLRRQIARTLEELKLTGDIV